MPERAVQTNWFPPIRHIAFASSNLSVPALRGATQALAGINAQHIIKSVAIRFKKSSELKHYLYISKTKVEMLYEQVASSAKENRSLEWALGVKALKLTRKTETQDEPDLDDKLKAVIEEIEALCLVGTAADPKEYIKGTLPMRWGLYRDAGRPDEEPPLVYFGGRIPDSVFGLGGSSRHVIGNCGASATGSRSATPALITHLLDGLGLPREGWNSWPRIRDRDDLFDYETCAAIALATGHLKGPDQVLEFYAKTLWTGRFLDRHSGTEGMTSVLLGSPLYVALASPYPADLSNY